MGYRFSEERVSRCGEVTVMALPAISGVDVLVVEAHPGKINGVVTVGAVLVGAERRGEMVGQLAHADIVVVANDAGQCRHVNRTVRESTGGEGSGGVADAAILGRRQMHTVGIKILTAGDYAVAGGAIVNESGMVYQSALAEECRLEKFGGMTVSAIGRGI